MSKTSKREVRSKAYVFVNKKTGEPVNWAMTTKNLTDFYRTVKITEAKYPKNPPKGFVIKPCLITLHLKGPKNKTKR